MSKKKIITQEDLDLTKGVKFGDEIELGPACDENGVALTGKAERAADDDAGSSTDIVGGREKDDR